MAAASDEMTDLDESGGVPDGDGFTDEDLLNYRRENNIRQRDTDWKKRQDETLMQKQVSWEVLRLEKENRLAAAREAARRKHCEERLKSKQEEVEREYRERCRDIAIEKRTHRWASTNNEKLCAYVTECKEKEGMKQQQGLDNKQSRAEALLAATMQKAEKGKQDAERESRREQNTKTREAERQSREADRVRKLKADAKIQARFKEIDKEANNARSAKGKSGLVRSVLLGAPRSELTQEEKDREARRQENLEGMRKARDDREAKRILECKAQLKKENDRFKGGTEQDIILARVPIFGTMT